ncbi:MAG TPA: ribonuclease III [Bacteroidota bacterium]|nr:ribonuclease III [Bacteroidota bacterium]
MLTESIRNLIHSFLPRRRVPNRIKDDTVRALLNGKPFPFQKFESILRYHPTEWRYFLESLLHRSYLQFTPAGWNSNERLEFLGDALLNFIVADFLHKQHPPLAEGELTKYRSRLVNRKILAQRARDLQLADFLFLSPSALQSLGSGSDSILADAFEAIIGALYLDGGLKAASDFVYHTLLENVDVEHLESADDNYKSALLEYSQAHALGIPKYSIVREEGPDHDRRFTIEVYLGNEQYGIGSGRSKKEAEQAAAFQALEKIEHMHAHQG